MIRNIQALRALAAMLVLVVHLKSFAPLLGWDQRAFLVGHCGVDLFFVISGFIMVQSVTARPTTAADFIVNRLIRVVPLYWAATLGLFALALVAPGLLGGTSADVRQLLLSLAFVAFDKGGGDVDPLLFLGWSLNYEMLFYLWFALGLALARGRPVLASGLAAVPVLALVAIGWVRPQTGPVAQFYTGEMPLEFVMGMATAYLTARRNAVPAVLAVAMVSLGLVLMIGVAPMLHAPRWLLRGGLACVVVLGAVWSERAGCVASARWLQATGAASYALYLSHPFVLQGFDKVAERIVRPEMVLALAAIAVLCAVGVALLIHRLFEVPVVNGLRRMARHRPPVTERTSPLAEKSRDNRVSAR